MRYVHPFPARMAPEIATDAISRLGVGGVVLDPMTGSGVVLHHAAKKGLVSIGYDLDPLARMIARVGASRANEREVLTAASTICQLCERNSSGKHRLDWIDDDDETLAFVRYWFARRQERQLRTLVFYLLQETAAGSRVREILQVAISRLIVTKSPKASLARDTSHSRPHRVILTNSYDVLGGFMQSVEYILKTVRSYEIKKNTSVHLGDARAMTKTPDESVDLIVTSPPYLNAIDYIRGHRLALVWFGYPIAVLRQRRSISIGSECAWNWNTEGEPCRVDEQLDCSGLTPRAIGMITRYFKDMTTQLRESYRVLKPGGSATYVIGNSRIRNTEIMNNVLLKAAAVKSGFEVRDEVSREIPHNKRYLPVSLASQNALDRRMKMEFVLSLLKTVRTTRARVGGAPGEEPV